MKRMIRFSGSDRDNSRFRRLYEAMASAQVSVRKMDVMRSEARIFGILDSISEPLDGQRQLRGINGPHDIMIEQPDFDLMVSYLELTPWTTIGAKEVPDLADFLASSEKID